MPEYKKYLGKVKVDDADTALHFLRDKLTDDGDSKFTEFNPGSGKRLYVEAKGSVQDDHVKDTDFPSLFTDGTNALDDDMSTGPRLFDHAKLLPQFTFGAATPNFTVGAGNGHRGSTQAYFSWASTALSLTAGDATNPRIDLVVVDYSAEPGTVSVVNGTAAATPQPPSPGANKLALFELYVPATITDIDAANVYRRLWQRAAAPLGQRWGIVQGCVPQWLHAATTANASFKLRTEVNSLIIDGEIIEGTSYLDPVNGGVGLLTDATNAPANTTGTDLKPFFLYACGGRHNPMSGENDDIGDPYIAKGVAPIVIVATTTAPTSAGHASAALDVTATLGARGTINKRGCVFIGVGFVRNDGGTTRRAYVLYQGDWVYAAGEHLYDSGAETYTPSQVKTQTITTVAPATSTAALVSLYFDDSATIGGDYWVGYAYPQTDLTVSHLKAPVSIELDPGSTWGGIATPGIIVITNDTGAKKFFTKATRVAGAGADAQFNAIVLGYNMNVPRLTQQGLGLVQPWT